MNKIDKFLKNQKGSTIEWMEYSVFLILLGVFVLMLSKYTELFKAFFFMLIDFIVYLTK